MELEAIREQLENEEVNLLQVELGSSSTHQSSPLSMSPQDGPLLNLSSPEPQNKLPSSQMFHPLLLHPQCPTPLSLSLTTRPDLTPTTPIDEQTPPTNLHPPPSPSPPLLYQSTRTHLNPVVLVWDVEVDETDDRVSLQSVRLRPPTLHPEAQMDEVYKTLNVLSAKWANTAPLTAQTTVV
uniref:Uncharacterized protein n=1 Tax=Moniliophthora roreri TaxID=221103 RepID=A0A0W0FK14_MONRR